MPATRKPLQDDLDRGPGLTGRTALADRFACDAHLLGDFPGPLGEHPDVLGRLAETLRRCAPSTATRQGDAGDPLVLLPSEDNTRSDSRKPSSRGD